MAKEKKNKNENRNFMKEFRAELKKVVWPTSKQMVNNVTAVIAIVLVTALVVFCLDLVFASINEYGINKLKTNIQSKSQTQLVENIDSNQESNNVENSENNAENTQEPNNEGENEASVNNDTTNQNNENVENNNSSEITVD